LQKKHLVVIGGGAAGFFCAINAAEKNKNLQVTIVEKTANILSKVKISGGGRCNTTHACFEIEALSKFYPRGERFLKKAFHWFNTNDTIEWFSKRGVTLKTETDGRMFPSTNNSQTIIDCLLSEAHKYGIKIITQTTIEAIEPHDNNWQIKCLQKAPITANFVCVATGGFPKATQFNWLTQLGHTIELPVPSLFTFNIPNNTITALMGLSVANVQVKITGTKLATQGPILITHWGLSGPAILKLSAFAARELANKNYEFNITVNWCSALENYDSIKQYLLKEKNTKATQLIANSSFSLIPKRLWHYFVDLAGISNQQTWATATTTQLNLLATILTQQDFKVKGKTTFKEEFVTCGGIKLNEIDVNTMQSKKCNNIFFVGEVLDVDGVTGGFNFQNAWTTGFIAAKAIAAL
jgi:predicted Rossmann fold flavoprotein